MKGTAAKVASAVAWCPPADYRWTKQVVSHPLRSADVSEIAARIEDRLQARHIEFPDQSALVRRCVQALLVGHLVLKGPPGSGKTTLARELADGFEAHLEETTATSDWTPFHVVGGLRPNAEGGLVAFYGKVAASVRDCAARVRDERDNNDLAQQATWLLIDEFNRADIDKAIGSLFTVLSTCDPTHLAETPIDLWFETEEKAQSLWVPARYRIIACMNDLDTAFVNTISQGLTRRFQFVTVAAQSARATESEPVTAELRSATAAARQWLQATYGGSLRTVADLAVTKAALEQHLARLQQVVDGLRNPPGDVPGWPVGTAQIVDVLRAVLLAYASDSAADHWASADDAVAARLVPQMSGIDDAQAKAFTELLRSHDLHHSAVELTHVVNPHDVA